MKNRLALGGLLITLAFLVIDEFAHWSRKPPFALALYTLMVWIIITLSAYGTGRLILMKLRFEYHSRIEFLTLALGIGYGVLGSLLFFIGVFGCLYAQALWFLLPLLVFISLRGEMPPVFSTRQRLPLSPGEKTIIFCLAVVAGSTLLLSLGPPTARDVLTQHLALPKLYVQHHRIYDVSFAESSFNPMQVDMLYTLVLLLKSEEAAGFIHGTFAFLTGALIYTLLRNFVPRWLSIMGSLLFLSTPLVIDLSSKAYVDLGVAFFAFAAIYALLQGKTRGKNWFLLSAVFAGLAAATKYNGFLVLLLLVPWALLILRKGENDSLSARKGLGAYCLVSLALALPWLLKNYMYSGNPIFPFLAGWMGIPLMSQEMYAPLSRRALLYGENLFDYLSIPVRMFFQGKDGNPQYFDGVLNPIFLFVSPLTIWGPKDRRQNLMWGFIILYFVFALFLVNMRSRYILPTLAPLAVLTTFGLEQLLKKRRGGLICVVVLTGFLSLNADYLYHHLQRADLGAYLLGKETRDAYLSRKLGDYDLWRFANQNTPQDSKVMMYFLGDRGYYSDREYCYETYYSGRQLKEVLSHSPSLESLRGYFRDRKVTHIALHRDLFASFLEVNLLPDERRAFDQFWARHLILLYDGKGYQLYRIQGEENASGL